MFFFVAPAVRPRMAPPAQETREEANTRIALQALRDLRPERQARGQLRTGWLVPKFCAIGQMAQALDIPLAAGTKPVQRELAARTLFSRAELDHAVTLNDYQALSGPKIADRLEATLRARKGVVYDA
jgi:hypothetical protein